MAGTCGALIVDDDEDMRFLVRTIIEAANQGLHVTGEAADGESGIRTWREHRPDVVLVDQRMPGLSGLEVAARILGEEPTQPIILFSAYLDDDLLARADRLGVRACLPKDAYRQVPDALWRYGGV
jgi:DNA-binding NarL/FixJ family response regulator